MCPLFSFLKGKTDKKKCFTKVKSQLTLNQFLYFTPTETVQRHFILFLYFVEWKKYSVVYLTKIFFSSFFHISRIKKNFSSTKQEVIQSFYYEYFLYLLYYDKSSFIIANYLIQHYETFEYCLLFYLAILEGRNVTPSDIYGYCSCRFNRTKIEVDDLSSERK